MYKSILKKKSNHSLGSHLTVNTVITYSYFVLLLLLLLPTPTTTSYSYSYFLLLLLKSVLSGLWKTMDNAEACFLVEEEKHIWQKKRKFLVFDQQTVDDELKKTQQAKHLKGLENDNKRLQDLLIKSKWRYDIEYKKIKDENLRLKQMEQTPVIGSNTASPEYNREDKQQQPTVDKDAHNNITKCPYCPKVFKDPFKWKSFRNHRKLCARKNK